jgi:hypothetical protein
MLPPKIAESDSVSLGHGLCGSCGSIYNKDTSQNTLSACTHNDRSRKTTQVGYKLSNAKISQQHPSSICFITPGWHITRDLNFIVFDNEGEFKREFKHEFKQVFIQYSYGIKAKSTIINNPQANAIIKKI